MSTDLNFHDSTDMEIWQVSDCMQRLNTQGDVDN